MAISKNQPMREAEIEVIDTLNNATEDIGDINGVLGQFQQELGAEIERATQAEGSLDERITALEEQLLGE